MSYYFQIFLYLLMSSIKNKGICAGGTNTTINETLFEEKIYPISSLKENGFSKKTLLKNLLHL